MKKKIYLISTILLLVLLTACNNASTVTPTEATFSSSTNDSAQTDTFIEVTDDVEETKDETEEPTEEKNDGVTVSENVTVERPETQSNRNTSSSIETSAPTPTSKPATATQSNKVWHNAVYKTVEHPAETQQVWVVDKEAQTVDSPIYEDKEVVICDVCGADITSSIESHQHDDGFTYHTEIQSVIVDYENVEIPEQGHYETVVVKEAWIEKILIKEAGYY